MEQTVKPESKTFPASGVTRIEPPLRPLLILLWACSTFVILLGVARELLAFVLHRPSTEFSLKVIRLDGENSLPSWYSSTVLLLSAFLLLLHAWSAYTERSKQFAGWAVLAGGFAYLSLDEVVMLHETLNDKLRAIMPTSGLFEFGWVLVAIPVVLLVAALLARFVLRLPPRTRLLFVVSGLVYVGGAVGLEMVGGDIYETWGRNGPGYVIAMIVEESFEIYGITLFLTALVLHARAEGQSWLLGVR